MPEVFVEISGRKYRMACEPGQESHLLALAARFDSMVDSFKGHFGEIGDTRLTVMAGLAVLDNLVEAEQKLVEINKRMEELSRAGEGVAREYEAMETRFAAKMEEVARRIEAAAADIESSDSR